MTTNWDQSSGSLPRGAGAPIRPAELVRTSETSFAPQREKPLAIVVAGMHRSGTSALARALALCGATLPRTLIPANESNEDGHWESEIIAESNDDLLASLGSAWDDALFLRSIRRTRPPREAVDTIKAAIRDQFTPGRDIVIKDPRISLLYAPWRQALQELDYDQGLVIAVRNPVEVAASLTRRNGFPPVKSALLWLSHLLTIEHDSRGASRAFVLYDDLLSDWRGCLRRVERLLGANLPNWNDTTETAIDAFLSPGKRHHLADINSLLARDDFPSWIAEAYRWAIAASSGDEELPPAILNRIADEFGAAADIYGPLLSFERNRANVRTRSWAEPPTPETAFEVSLYSATAEASFDEATRTFKTIKAINAPRSYEVTTHLHGRLITELRIDPAEARGTLVLHALRTRSPAGVSIWEWPRGDLSLFASAVGISAVSRSTGTVLLEFTHDDPQFRLPVEALAGDHTQITVEFVVSTLDQAEQTTWQTTKIATDLADLRNAAIATDAAIFALRSELRDATSVTALTAELTELRRSAAAERHAQASAISDLQRATQAHFDSRASEISAFLQQQLQALEGDLSMHVRAAAEGTHTDLTHQRHELGELARRVDALHEIVDAQIDGQQGVVRIAEDLRARFDYQQSAMAVFSADLARQIHQTEEAILLAHSYGQTSAAMRASTSWRLTAPLRVLRQGPRAWFARFKSLARRGRNAIKRQIWGKSYALTAAHSPELEAQARLLSRTSYFNPAWYLAHNQDVQIAEIDPLLHYLLHGGFEGRSPSPAFDSRWYLAQNPDVSAAGINPLVHYLLAGRREARAPLPDSESPAHLKVGQHLERLTSTRHLKYLIANTGLAFDPLLPRRVARRLRASAHANRPEPAPHQVDNGEGSGVHTAAYDQMLAASSAKGEDYVPLTTTEMKTATRLKTIAFYLPQFHPIPENDAWWGKGFTEWTNVSKATPQFIGHYQPRLPDELGYYDLRVPDVQRRQVELAKLYGVHGFCFHYYWFTGRKRLLERPLNQFLADQDIDFPFCICWANENWTRRWDGLDQDILMEQRHEPQDDLQFIEDLAPLLRDPRYIRVNGRPLIIVYRVDILADAKRTASVWRAYCRANGIDDPLLVAAQTFGIKDPRPFGFDAAVEFPPHADYTPEEVTREKTMLNPRNSGRVYDYARVVKRETQFNFPDYQLFKTIIPSWDNEARKPGKGYAFTDATPALYRKWLTTLLRATDSQYANPEEKLVFINAWNEWAEGAYLEPDRRFGYGYLQATRDALSAFPAGVTPNAQNATSSPLYIFVHAFHLDVFEEMLDELALVRTPFRLVVTCPPDRAALVRDSIASSGIRYASDVVETENRGRDVLAFFEALRRVPVPANAIILKLHTKKSTHREDGAAWRREMLGELVNADTIESALEGFARDNQLSLIAPAKHLAPITTYIGFNQDRIEALLRRGGWSGINMNTDVFAAGTMFFIRRRSLDSIMALNIARDEFEQEEGQKDGTMAHALERMFGLVILREGGRIIDTNTLINGATEVSGDDFAFAVKTDYLFRSSDKS